MDVFVSVFKYNFESIFYSTEFNLSWFHQTMFEILNLYKLQNV